jgi:pyruvate ferredoxin oxidoreductase beta subunit
VTKIRRRVAVEDYLRAQSRYAHLFAPELRTDVLGAIATQVQQTIDEFELLDQREVAS